MERLQARLHLFAKMKKQQQENNKKARAVRARAFVIIQRVQSAPFLNQMQGFVLRELKMFFQLYLRCETGALKCRLQARHASHESF